MFTKDGIHISDVGFECIYQFKIFKKQQVNCFQMRNQLDNNDWYGESSGLSQRVKIVAAQVSGKINQIQLILQIGIEAFRCKSVKI